MCAQRPCIKRGRPSRPVPKALPADLYDYDNDPAPRNGIQRRAAPLLGPDGQRMHVTDDWPDDIPVTDAEIQIFERWFGDVFDELLSSASPKNALPVLSVIDKKRS